jgi:3-hydroxyacyl-CoA dehydrogenase
MTQTHPVHRVAIVGTGTIGASPATHYLARGFDVVATDPAPGAEHRLRSYVDAASEAAGSPVARPAPQQTVSGSSPTSATGTTWTSTDPRRNHLMTESSEGRTVWSPRNQL